MSHDAAAVVLIDLPWLLVAVAHAGCHGSAAIPSAATVTSAIAPAVPSTTAAVPSAIRLLSIPAAVASTTATVAAATIRLLSVSTAATPTWPAGRCPCCSGSRTQETSSGNPVSIVKVNSSVAHSPSPLRCPEIDVVLNHHDIHQLKWKIASGVHPALLVGRWSRLPTLKRGYMRTMQICTFSFPANPFPRQFLKRNLA